MLSINIDPDTMRWLIGAIIFCLIACGLSRLAYVIDMIRFWAEDGEDGEYGDDEIDEEDSDSPGEEWKNR